MRAGIQTRYHLCRGPLRPLSSTSFRAASWRGSLLVYTTQQFSMRQAQSGVREMLSEGQ